MEFDKTGEFQGSGEVDDNSRSYDVKYRLRSPGQTLDEGAAWGISWNKLATGYPVFNGARLKSAFLSNPLGWIMVGVQAVYALCSAFQTVQREAFNAKKDLEEFNQSMSDLASEQDVYAQKMERLKEFSQQQYLSNREQAEAIRLVNQLKEQYPSLNIEFDKTTGRIKGMTGAYESLLEQMRQERLRPRESVSTAMSAVLPRPNCVIVKRLFPCEKADLTPIRLIVDFLLCGILLLL